MKPFKNLFTQSGMPDDFVFPTGTGESAKGAISANIFIHGYSAWRKSQDREALWKFVPDSLAHDVNIFCCWESGHFVTAIPEAVFGGGGIKFVIPNAARALGGPASAIYFGYKIWKNFKKSRLKAEQMGAVLLPAVEEHLLACFPYITQVNLVGHSLGSRLIAHSLLNISKSTSLEIGDVMLMAGAVDISPEDAERIRCAIMGRLINIYSKMDRVLQVNFGERSIGRRELEWAENFEMPYGHLAYWSKLEEIIEKARFGQPALCADRAIEKLALSVPRRTHC